MSGGRELWKFKPRSVLARLFPSYALYAIVLKQVKLGATKKMLTLIFVKTI